VQFDAEPPACRWIFCRQDPTLWIRTLSLHHGTLHDDAGAET
jgi:hypothetical protein